MEAGYFFNLQSLSLSGYRYKSAMRWEPSTVGRYGGSKGSSESSVAQRWSWPNPHPQQPHGSNS